jgi:hypothetical protein
MTDREIIKCLIARDSRVTEDFFFTQCCPLFCGIIGLVFSYEVDYDELVNELYVYLMENDAQKLRDFEYRSSVYTWLKILAIRFFIKKRDIVIYGNPERPLYEAQVQTLIALGNDDFAAVDGFGKESEFVLSVAVFFGNGGVVEIATVVVSPSHNGNCGLIVGTKIRRQHGHRSAQNRNRSKAKFRDTKTCISKSTVAHCGFC